MDAHPYLTLDDCHLLNQYVMVREDFNVPMHEGCITDASRIRRALPTIRQGILQDARIILISHLGRPIPGEFDPRVSLAPVAAYLTEQLGQPVDLIQDWLNGVAVAPGQVVLCENVRFLTGEKENDPQLAKRMASLCDIFVMDAFAVAHRQQASIVGVAEYAPMAVAGPLFVEEMTALESALEIPKRPLAAVVGGAKVTTKIAILHHLLEKVDSLVVGGGIANTFLKAKGYEIGRSLYDKHWLDSADSFFAAVKKNNVVMLFPEDVIVAQALSSDATPVTKEIGAVLPEEAIFDIGPKTLHNYRQLMLDAKTILWNGPLGVFEYNAFRSGTVGLAKVIAASSAYSVVGGGDTLAAIAELGIDQDIGYKSTGGGAFLTWMEGGCLPALDILKQRNKQR